MVNRKEYLTLALWNVLNILYSIQQTPVTSFTVGGASQLAAADCSFTGPYWFTAESWVRLSRDTRHVHFVVENAENAPSTRVLEVEGRTPGS